MSQKLREIINTHSAVLGSTSDGSDWCLKALHPSDPLTEVRGIPDETAPPSVFLNYQTTAVIQPEAAATGVWGFNMQVMPHPINFASVLKTDSTGSLGEVMLNSQIVGADHAAKMLSFLGIAAKWRLAYAGVTIHQDGPSLANQGTIVACQNDCSQLILPIGGNYQPTGDVFCGWNTGHFPNESLPDFTKCQSMPSAYFNNSKDGLYMPLKLTKTHQHWYSPADNITHGFPYPSTAIVGVTSGAGVTGIWPYYDLAMSHLDGNVTPPEISAPVTTKLCSDMVGNICVQNVSVETRFTCFFRYGFELQVYPGTVYTPQQKLSPKFDKQAIETYFAVARELKDAYPADYNDLGGIWKVISSILSTVGPALSMIPAVGPALSIGANALNQFGNSIAGRQMSASRASNSKTYNSIGSLADQENLRAMIDSNRALLQRSASAPRRRRRVPNAAPTKPKARVNGNSKIIK